jgi:hypothetical protein
MFHVKIDSVATKHVVAFECGTRSAFDVQHGGDPTWMFIDKPEIEYRTNIPAFLRNPTQFMVDSTNALVKIR